MKPLDAIAYIEMFIFLAGKKNKDSKLIQACIAGVEVLRKEIGRQPKGKRKSNFYNHFIGRCPNCGKNTNSHKKFCNDCGQKFYWGIEK